MLRSNREEAGNEEVTKAISPEKGNSMATLPARALSLSELLLFLGIKVIS